MKATEKRKLFDGAREGIALPHEAAEHLRAALGQMDLLLATRQIDFGTRVLDDLLRHLRAVRHSMN